MARSASISPIIPNARLISVAAGTASSPSIPDNCAILAPARSAWSPVKPNCTPISLISSPNLACSASVINLSNSILAAAISLDKGTVLSTISCICSLTIIATSSIPEKASIASDWNVAKAAPPSITNLLAWKVPTTSKKILDAPARFTTNVAANTTAINQDGMIPKNSIIPYPHFHYCPQSGHSHLSMR